MSDFEHSVSAAEPEKARDPQVERLAGSARELARSIKAANGLPPRFPEEEMLALADALQAAPPADFDAVLEAALYTRERFVATREEFVIEAPDDPDLPGIEAVANRLNDTIAELSTTVAKAGREAASAALPTRQEGKGDLIAAEAVETEVSTVRNQVESAVTDVDALNDALKANASAIHIHIHNDRHDHYNLLNFTNTFNNLKLSIKTVGAIFKAGLIDRAWLDKLLERLERGSTAFASAWDAVREVLQQVKPVLAAVQRLTSNVADLIGAVRSFVRRVFKRHGDALKPGTIFRDVYALWCPEMVVIPPGEFVMGSTEAEREWSVDQGVSRHWVQVEKPQHRVRIEAALAIGRYPVTFEEYDRFADATGREKPHDEGWGRARRPVINVSWEDAKAYVGWLSEETGQDYRLLSEAQWEYAARAGTTTRHWWGDDITSENASFDKNVGKTSEAGAHYPQNPWGLYDMNGNVWEWVEDCWNENYENATSDGSAWITGDCNLRIIRGGSWKSKPGILRAAYRNRHPLRERENNIGFRVARTLTD